MGIPNDFPQRLAAAGLAVTRTKTGSRSDRAPIIVRSCIHHTASGKSTSPKSDADYCHSGSDDSPLYNVLVDRTGVVWLLTGRKSNSSGKISGTALDEAVSGRADLTPAARARALRYDEQ